MKQYTVYVCEICGLENINYDYMRAHEAAHLGLTVEEMETYQALKASAAHMGSVIASKNNEETQSHYDEAVEKLVAFEQLHGIKA